MPALIALLLTAFVMRGPVTGVGPVAAEVVAAYGTTWSLYGLLAALPVAAFGLCSFLAPALQARLGLCGAASAALGLLFLGTALRFIANLAAFAGGMFLLVVIKTRWPRRIGMLMGLYTGMIGLSGAVGGLTAAPLFAWGGSLSWPFGFWTAAAVLALMVWLLLMQCGTQGLSNESPCSASKPAADKQRPQGLLRRTMRMPLAWILTGVMGLQSTLIYTAAAWMPSYWRAQGMSFETTGIWIFVFLFSGLPASVMTAKFFKVCPNDRTAGAVLTLLYVLGLAGWLAGGAWLLPASVAAGAAQGAMLSAAFLLMASHTKGSQAMLAVSTLSQGIGYLAAGAGPFIFGRLLQATGGWTAPFVFFTAVILLWGLCVRLADTHQTID
mgnify:CR=1 FL=1